MQTAPEPGQKLRYLALGDSYTIGEAVDIPERWPLQLADSLRRAGINMAEPDIIAQTGWTTGELMEAIRSQAPQGPYHLVTLLIGVNNQYRGLDTAEYRKDAAELLDIAISFAGGDAGNVITVSIPDYGVTPFARDKMPEKIAREIDEFNDIKKNESLKAGVKYIDITAVSRMADKDSSLLATDGLHPSGKMYAEWVKIILPEAKNNLEKQRGTEL